MQDREIVGAIVAGEPSGLAAAYDRYASALYAYCRTLLADPAHAADAVQDTFIVAGAKLGGLREPFRLRPWLYAVARNECHRRLVAGVSHSPPEEVPRAGDNPAPLGSEAERAELRALVGAALSGLASADREAIELTLRHEMAGAALASVLGLPRGQAQALVARARAQFEASLGALLVARSGRDFCPGLDLLLADWDGRLTALLCKRVNRHLGRCRVCADRKRREMSPAMLLAMLPVYVLPSALRERVLHLAADPSGTVASYRELVVTRAGLFTRSGFPELVRPGAPAAGSRAYTLAALGAAVFLILIGGGTVYSLHLINHHPARAGARAATPPATTAPPAAVAEQSTPAATPTVATSPPIITPTTPPGTTSPSPGTSRSGSPSPSTSPPPSPSPSPSTSPPPTPSPVPVTLTASPSTVTLAQSPGGGTYTGQFTLTAQGGTADFSVTDPAPAGDLVISPLSGSLADGQSVVVSVAVASGTGLPLSTPLTVDPGGITVTVVYPPAGLPAGPLIAGPHVPACSPPDACFPPGGGAQPVPARSRAAASVIAVSLPNATSRGRYFIPQSGASTSRSAGT